MMVATGASLVALINAIQELECHRRNPSNLQRELVPTRRLVGATGWVPRPLTAVMLAMVSICRPVDLHL